MLPGSSKIVSWEALGAFGILLGAYLGALKGILGVFSGLLEGSWGLLERSWELLEASWERLGRLLGVFLSYFVAILQLERM